MTILPLYNCVCCTSTDLHLVLDLGSQSLANNLKQTNNETQAEYPLAINVCSNCFHVQLTHAVDPKLMFENYLYVSGTTKTLQQYFDWFANYIVEDCYPKKVLDIGCNDGTQLDYFKKHKIQTFGIDPAQNLVNIAREKGHTIENAFIDANYNTNNQMYDCIIAQNVFAHNSNPYEFLLKCENMLSPEGTLYIQVSQVDMIERNEFDTIYHEHISFFNINSMNTLIGRTKTLYLVDVIKVPIHGNSYIFGIKKTPRNYYRISNLLKMEQESGLYSLETYTKYKENVYQIKNSFYYTLFKHCFEMKQPKCKIVGYGAAAKGMTFLNFIDLNKMEYIIDDNALKQGKYATKNNIPILSIDELQKEDPTTTIIFIPLAWNFFTEIKDRIKKVRNNPNDKFIKYFPTVEII